MVWLLSVLLALSPFSSARPKRSRAAAAPSSQGRPVNLPKVGSCAVENPAKTVFIVKQWHLAPTTVTKGFKEKYPQERNQTAIYKALAESIKKKQLQLVVSEGCEGEINAEFKRAFNGWDYSSLRQIAQTKNYEKTLSLIPLKLEARYGDGVSTLCGDSDELIKEGNLRLSNLRGWMGFWTRLHETYPDDRGRLYADAAADLLKLPKDTPTPELIKNIRAKVKEELEAFRKSLNDRNDAFVKTLQSAEFKNAAVVIGGLHADDLRAKLEAAGLGCEVLEPPGYQREQELLIGEFEKVMAVTD